MAAKCCLESYDEDQAPPLRYSRGDNNRFQSQHKTTENLLRLIQTVDEMKKHKSTKLLKLINEVRSRSEPPPEPIFEIDQFINNSEQSDMVSEAGPEPIFDFDQFINNSEQSDMVSEAAPEAIFDFINSQQSGELSESRLYPIFEQFANTQTGEGNGTLSHRTLDLNDPRMGLTQDEIDSLVRHGGGVGGYTIVPRARFNGLEIHRIINFREISSTDLTDYTVFLHDRLSEIVTFSRLLAGCDSLINITLRGPTLTSDVNTLLSAGNDYCVDVFINEFEKITQSNSDVQFDESLNLRISIARTKQGGGRRKISDIAHNKVIRKNTLNLFKPLNIGSENNLCFGICLAHFLNPQKPHTELEAIASALQKAAGYTDQHMISLSDIVQFERLLNIKIVVFYRTTTGMLEKFTNTDVPHPKTVFLYLHDNHYFLIKKTTRVYWHAICV